jgi:peptide/nickel transport system ATP-binding protein
LRLINPTAGELRFGNVDLVAIRRSKLKKLRKDIQIIFQDPYSSLNPKMTVGKALTEPMAVHHIGMNHRERKERALEFLEKVGLEKQHYDRYPHELSGGQRQRVCIARALSVEPKFIVCDESVSALDVSVQAQVLNLLKSLKDEFGFTYIFISHDLSVVKFISDRVAVMKEGKIIETGTAEEIYLHPKSEYTKQLIDSIPS